MALLQQTPIKVDTTVLFGTTGFISLLIANIALYFKIPENRHPLRWIAGINFVSLIIANIALYISITPREVALKYLLLLDVVGIFGFVNAFLIRQHYKRQELALTLFWKSLGGSAKERMLELLLHQIHDVQISSILRDMISNADLLDLNLPLSLLMKYLPNVALNDDEDIEYRVCILRPNPDGSFKVLAASPNTLMERVRAMEQTLRWKDEIVGIEGRCVRDRNYVICSDLADSSRTCDSWVALTPNQPEQEPKGALCIPILGDSVTPLGVLSIVSSRPNVLHEDRLERLSPIINKIYQILQLYDLYMNLRTDHE